MKKPRGFRQPLQAGYNTLQPLQAGYNTLQPLQAGYNTLQARGFEQPLQAGYNTLQSRGFEQPLQAGYNTLQSRGFEQPLQDECNTLQSRGFEQPLQDECNTSTPNYTCYKHKYLKKKSCFNFPVEDKAAQIEKLDCGWYLDSWKMAVMAHHSDLETQTERTSQTTEM